MSRCRYHWRSGGNARGARPPCFDSHRVWRSAHHGHARRRTAAPHLLGTCRNLRPLLCISRAPAPRSPRPLHRPGASSHCGCTAASALRLPCQQPSRLCISSVLVSARRLRPADRVCRALAVSPLTRKRAFSAVMRAALVRCRRFRCPARNQRPCARAHRSAVIPSRACQSLVPLRPAAIPFCACRLPHSFAPCCPASVRFLHRRTAVAWQIRNAI